MTIAKVQVESFIKFHDLPILWELEPENTAEVRSKWEQACESHYAKNPNFKLQYTECIQNYIHEGYLTVRSNNEVSEQGYYLPHHAVVKECSVTTKTRVVFGGSAQTSTGISFDTLLVDATIQEDRFSTVVRFKSFLYAFTADIQQMYRQIRVDPEDSVFQKIL